MNASRMFFALSWTVGPAVAAWIMRLYSYEGLFVSAAACFFLFAAITRLALPKTPPAKTKASADESVLKVLARWDVAAHFMGFVLIFASGTIGMMNLPLLVLKALGGNEHHIAIVYSVAPVFELPFMLYFGLLATRKDPASVIRAGIVIAVIYYGLLSLVQAPWHVYLLQILSAAVTSVTSGVAITYFQNYLPNHPGTATNLYATASRIGSTVGYLLFGTLAAHFAHRTVFVACAIFAGVTLVLLQVSPRARKTDTPAAA
jgi:MFS transporter, SET family, sugar efflux transporter